MLYKNKLLNKENKRNIENINTNSKKLKMGKVMSLVVRKVNRFNVENRAHKIISQDKPVPAPKYESNVQELERVLDRKFLLFF